MTDTTVLAGAPRSARLDMQGNDTLSIGIDAVFSVSANAQTVRFVGPTDGASIGNDGLLENTRDGGRAIRFETGVGATLEASIHNRGTISSLDDAIQIQDGTVVAGKVSVINQSTGSITSATGQAIDFASGRTDFVTALENHGFVGSQTNDGVRVGGIGEISNDGTIDGGSAAANSASADGIQFEDNTSGTVTNNTNGTISGDRHGINAGEGSDITVTNNVDATISGRNGSGVGSDGSATVINYGTITGSFITGLDTNGTPSTPAPDGTPDGDGDGVDIDFLATIENYGTIEGLGAGGTGSDGLPNTSEGIAAGGGTINNYAGATISGAGLGILIDDSSQGNAPFLTTIVNNGTITGGTGFAIRIVSDLDDTITNSGTIAGGGGNAIQFGSGDNTLFIDDGSVIVGLSDGGLGSDTLDFVSFSSAVTVDLNAGTASGTGGVVNFENILGGAQGDALTGSTSDNAIAGNGGDDTIDGLDGIDTAVYAGALADYSIVRNGSVYTIAGGTDGVDTVSNVEFLTFSNGTFAIDDVAETIPTDLRLSRTAISEDTSIWTTVGLLKADDADGDALTYTLVDDAGGLFRVRGERLITSGTFDFEAAQSHTITVAVSDGINTVQKDFTITVGDVLEAPANTAPTDLKLSRLYVAENVKIGTSVGLLSAVDPEGASLRYKLLDDADAFRLLGNKLVTTAQIDFEQTQNLTITVEVTDSLGLATVQDFTLAVRDQFEPSLAGATAFDLFA